MAFADSKTEPKKVSKNQLYKQYVNVASTGKQPVKSYKDWLNIVKDQLPGSMERYRIEPIASDGPPTLSLNADGNASPSVPDKGPTVEQFRIMGFTTGQLIAGVVITTGLVIGSVMLYKRYKKGQLAVGK